MMHRSIPALLALAAAAMIGGCSGGNSASARHSAVVSDPTPALDTLYQREVEIENRLVLTEDENWRMFNQDLGRFWLVDRPSRLTREPVPR